MMALLLISSQGLSDEQSQGDQTSSAKQEMAFAVPDLGKIMPLATELSSRLAALENRGSGLLDITVVERGHVETEEDIKELASQLQQLKDSKEYRHNKIADLKQLIKEEYELFEKTSKPLIWS